MYGKIIYLDNFGTPDFERRHQLPVGHVGTFEPRF